jgi:hypothetical protein
LPWATRSPIDVDAHRARGAGDDLRGGVEVVGVEVGHLALGDLADLVRGDRPTLFTWGSPEPFEIRIASLISTAAGGVLVMKVKERSS